jgi:hypothetical protein
MPIVVRLFVSTVGAGVGAVSGLSRHSYVIRTVRAHLVLIATTARHDSAERVLCCGIDDVELGAIMAPAQAVDVNEAEWIIFSQSWRAAKNDHPQLTPCRPTSGTAQANGGCIAMSLMRWAGP